MALNLSYTHPEDQTKKLHDAFQRIGSFDLAHILGIINRQWKLALALTLLTVMLTAALLSQLSYRYTAEALVTIDQRESQLAGQGDEISNGITLNNRVDTEVEILGSNSVMYDAVDRLALWRDAEFGVSQQSFSSKLAGAIGLSKESPKIDLEATRLSELQPQIQTQLSTRLNKAISIQRRGLTSVIAISATSKDPEKSAKLANTIAESYMDVQIRAKAKTAQRAADFLATRVDEIAKDIQATEGNIENFILQQSALVGTPEAQAELLRLRTNIDELSSTGANLAAEVSRMASLKDNIDSVAPGSLPAELRAMAEQRQALMQKAAAEGAAPNLTKELAAINNKLNAAIDDQKNTFQERLAVSDKQKEELRTQLKELFGRQQIPAEVSVNLFRLQREAESKRKLYESFSARLGEVQQQAELAVPNSRIVSPAIVPATPSFPPSLKALALATLVGLGLGTAAAMARENLIGGFASPAQFEGVTGLGIAATIPRYEGSNPHNAIVDAPFSSYAEAVRRLRLSVEESSGASTAKTMVITSTEPNEGKSTVAVSLARAYALSGYSTLLIDADLRHPSVGKLMGIEAGKGLLGLLPNVTDKLDITKHVHRELETGLFVLPTPTSLKQASDVLLGSAQFSDLVAAARTAYDFVVIDSPPIGYVVDARLIASRVERLIYVVKQNAAAQLDTIAGIRQFIDQPNCPPLNVVLNDVHNALGSYYYRNSKYSKYYKSAD